MIPINGSTLTVVIDGVVSGHPTYNLFRSDIACVFPGYKNSNGAVGFLNINTTALGQRSSQYSLETRSAIWDAQKDWAADTSPSRTPAAALRRPKT
jgi:hypothetical protein